MQLSHPVGAYRRCVERAFCELLIGHEYATELPNMERATKFLSRIKEAEFDSSNPLPGLTTTELCKTGLPVNWTYAQFNRGPLQYIVEDDFRMDKVRCLSDDMTMFDEERWGFGRVELNFWMMGNNGSSAEAAEATYYMRLYKLRSVDYLYLGVPWHSRVEHDQLQSFEPIGIEQYGTGFAITWRAEIYVPILREEIEGFTVQEICTEVFPTSASLACPVFPGPQSNLDEAIENLDRETTDADFTIISSMPDENTLNIQTIDGGCPDGTEPPDSNG